MPFKGQKFAKGCLSLGLYGMCSSENGTHCVLKPTCSLVSYSCQKQPNTTFTPWVDKVESTQFQMETFISMQDIPGNVYICSHIKPLVMLIMQLVTGCLKASV